MPPRPAYLAAGRKTVEAKEYKTAIVELESALKIVPTSTSVLGEFGWAYFRDGQLDKAEESTSDAVRVSIRAKQHGALHYNLGRIHEAAAKKDESRSEYTESLSYRINDTVQKRVETSLHELRPCETRRPGRCNGTLGCVGWRDGQHEGAERGVRCDDPEGAGSDESRRGDEGSEPCDEGQGRVLEGDGAAGPSAL